MNKKSNQYFQKGIFQGLGIVVVILFSSCKFSFEEDKLSQVATALNLAKPLSEKQARIILQCDADTPTGYKSLRGTVLDYDTSNPIQNAFASSLVSTEVYATDGEGKFKIQKIGMETTRVTLKVTADIYKSLSTPVDFSCQNLSALIYLPKDTQTGGNTTSTPTDSNPTGSASTACIFSMSIYGGCKL